MAALTDARLKLSRETIEHNCSKAWPTPLCNSGEEPDNRSDDACSRFNALELSSVLSLAGGWQDLCASLSDKDARRIPERVLVLPNFIECSWAWQRSGVAP